MTFGIAQRVGLLLVIAVIASVIGITIQLVGLKFALHDERKAAVRMQVEAAASIATEFAQKAQKGLMSEEEAKERARVAIRDIRYGNNNYLFAFLLDGTSVIMGPKREMEDTDISGLKDANGVFLIKEMIKVAKTGGGYVNYMFPRAGSKTAFNKISYAMKVEPWQWVIGTGVYTDDLDAIFMSWVWIAAMCAVGLIVAVCSFAIPLALDLIRPIRAMTETMGIVASGDTSTVVPGRDRKDEIGDMAKAVEHFRLTALEKEEVEQKAAEEREKVEEERRRNAAEQQHALDLVGDGLHRLADGELTIKITTDVAPSYNSLKEDFNLATNKLHEAMISVDGGAKGIKAKTGEITQASDELSRRTESQAASLEETVAALAQITDTVKDNAKSSSRAKEVVSAAKLAADESCEVVHKAIEAMGGIERSSNEINQIIGLIDEIAFQTNLLALNAGVEAARAGEAGRGFAVVASEVRGLAQRSAHAARDIKKLVSNSSEQVEHGVKLVSKTVETLDSIKEEVSKIDDVFTTIVAGGEAQSSGLAEVNSAIQDMDQITQDNAAMSEEITAASSDLLRETNDLSHLVGTFEISASTGRLELVHDAA